MILHRHGEVWALECGYEERGIAKAAGAWWHGKHCRAGCKACSHEVPQGVWWTHQESVAARLIEFCADEAVRAELSGRANEIEAALDGSRATDADCEIPAPPGLEYLPYQRAGIAYAMNRRGTLFGDEMGLGKTIQALGLVNAQGWGQVLCIVPASLRLNWLREAEKWLVGTWNIGILEAGAYIPRKGNNNFLVTNYDRVSGPRNARFRQQILGVRWDCLIVDEAHFIKNPDAARSAAILGRPEKKGRRITRGKNRGKMTKGHPEVVGLVTGAEHLAFLTGTPLPNRPIELYGLVHALAPEQFPSRYSFGKKFANGYKGRFGWDFTGSSNLPELQRQLRTSCMVRRLKADVLKDLPPKVRQVIAIEPEGEARSAVADELAAYRAHEDAISDARAAVAAAEKLGDRVAYEGAVAALQAAESFAFSEISRERARVSVAKIPVAAAHVLGVLEEAKKVVVMAHHHEMIDGLALSLSQAGHRVVTLTGRESEGQKQAAVDAFQGDPGTAVFIGQIHAAGVGLTLTASSLVVMAELDWVPGNVQQCEDRCHRIGQQDTVVVHHVVFDGSLDCRMAELLVDKQKVADAALDEPVDLSLPAPEPKRPSRSPDGSGAPRYPVATDEARAAAHLAMRILAGQCDGAIALDGAGFNAADTGAGHSLAACSHLTDGQVWLATKLARKYQRQLPEEILVALEIRESAA